MLTCGVLTVGAGRSVARIRRVMQAEVKDVPHRPCRDGRWRRYDHVPIAHHRCGITTQEAIQRPPGRSWSAPNSCTGVRT